MGNRPKSTEITEWYGLNTKTSKAVTPLGFSSDLRNMDLSIPGVAKTAGGTTDFTANTLGFDGVRIHDFYQPSTTTHFFLVQGGTKIVKLSSVGVDTDLVTGLTADEISDFVNFKNECFTGNGTDEGKVIDGTSSRKWGIDPPGSVASLASGAAGTPNGTYQYFVTFFNSTTGHESNPHTTPAVITVSSARIEMTSIPVSSDAQVDQRRVYRTTTGGAIFFLLTTIADNTTTVFSDNTADSALSTSEVPQDNDPPNKFVFLEEWDGRIWGVQKNSTEVEFSNSEFLTPSGSGVPQESFSLDNRVFIFREVRGIKKSPNFDELWVHTTKGVIAIKKTNDPDDPYEPVTRNEDESAVSHYSLVNIYNEQWFINEEAKVIGIDSAGFISYKSNLIEPNLTGTRGETGSNGALLKDVQAVHYKTGTKNQYRFIITESGETFPNRMYAANYLQSTPRNELGDSYPVWEKHHQSLKALGIVRDSTNKAVLYGTTDGQHVRELDTGTNDNGSAIDWSFSIGWARTSLTPDITDLARWIKSYFEPSGNFNISMQISFNFGTQGGQTYSINLSQAGDLLDDTFILDQSLLGGLGLKENVQDVVGDYNYIEVKLFGNALDQVMELHNMVLIPHEQQGLRRETSDAE